ncbi:MAG: MerR family transcriptional regulator [Nocardioides sp.]
MLTIGEFARYAGVSVRMLRHYDALGLLAPQAVDPFTGYRRYAPEQLARAHQLVTFKELGFTLEQVGELLDGAEPAQVGVLLRRRRTELADQLARDAGRLAEVERRLRLIEGESAMEFHLTSLPALRLAQLSGEATDQAQIGDVIGPLFERLVQAYGGELPGPSLAWYVGEGDRIRLAAAVEERGAVPEGVEEASLAAVPRAVVTTYRGPIAGIGEAWQLVGAPRAAPGHEPAGVCREVYHEIHLDGSGDEVVELQQPVA